MHFDEEHLNRSDLDLLDLLAECSKRRASDLHLTLGEPPIFRIDGMLRRSEFPVLRDEDLNRIIYGTLSDSQQVQFDREFELDFALTLPGAERFRVNIHRQRSSVEAAFRRVPITVPTLESLHGPSVAADLARKPNGLVLVTGPTGMGKTTTMAALINLINQERECLIVTIEDPIEYIHTNKKAIIKQREVGNDTHSFAVALRHALRQDPEVIVVGEMRDLETISTTLTAAETGHLVFATLHTPDAVQTISRIIDVFPPNQQEQVRLQLSDSLQGIISQLLLPHASGHGRVLATEVLVANASVRNLIREQQLQQISSFIQTNSKLGMHTMDASLVELYQQQKISHETLISKGKDTELYMRAIVQDPEPAAPVGPTLPQEPFGDSRWSNWPFGELPRR
jgi:twitching motility protein PilT